MTQPNGKIAKLRTLGFIEDLPDFDYISELSLETRDLPDLMELISRNTVLKDSPADTEYWAPLHAALAISQFQHPSALAALIESFDYLNELNLAEEILPIAVASFGQQALRPLEQHFTSQGKNQLSYVIAMDSLMEICQQLPETKSQVFAILKDYMANPIKDAADLNALLIAHLMEIEAVEFIEDIRSLYNSSEVDIYCVGDIEDVEINLGLRDKRSTTRAIATILAEDIANESTGIDDDDDYLSVLEYILLEYGNENAIHNISELDGYFAAIGCSPEPIQPSTWFPLIWGSSNDTPQFERKETAEVFSELAIQLYNESMEQLLQGEYHPMFGEVEGSELMVVDEWCMGFMRGLGLWAATSTEDQASLEKYIAPIQYFCGENLEIFNRSNHKKTLKHQNSIAPNVIKIRRLMFKLSQGTFVHETAKIGRNDPCSCGSGKKYKKCCGLN